MKPTHLLLAAVLLLSFSSAEAQGNGKGKGKDKKEYKKKEYKDKDRNDYAKDRDERYKKDKGGSYGPGNQQTAGGVDGIIGRVIVPRAGTAGPRKLAGVPKGHYPPPGKCRIWYPNRPPGHQPSPVSCDRLAGVRLEPGAFVLHGDQAYDAEYDWRTAEQRRPGTVGRDILDILFPGR